MYRQYEMIVTASITVYNCVTLIALLTLLEHVLAVVSCYYRSLSLSVQAFVQRLDTVIWGRLSCVLGIFTTHRCKVR